MADQADQARPGFTAGAEWSYHHLHVTTADIPRARLFNLPYGLMVTCNRVAGWELWDASLDVPAEWKLLAGEYAGPDQWLVLDVAGYIILDSRKPAPAPEPETEASRG